MQSYVNVVGNGARKKVEGELKKLLENDVEDGSKHARLRDLYNDCIDTETLDDRGWEPLKTLLKTVGIKIADLTASDSTLKWFDYIYKIRESGGDDNIFIEVYVEPDIENIKNRIIYVDQSLGGDLNPGDTGFKENMIKMLELLGVEQQHVDDVTNEITEFSWKMYNITYPDSWYDSQSDADKHNKFKIRKLNEQYPQIPWMNYFTNLLAVGPDAFTLNDDTEVVVRRPQYFDDLG